SPFQDTPLGPVELTRRQMLANDLHVLDLLSSHTMQVLPLDVVHGDDPIGQRNRIATGEPQVQVPVLAVADGGVEAADRQEVTAIYGPGLLQQVSAKQRVLQLASVDAF